MNKIVKIFVPAIFLILFMNLPCWADPCKGDLNCDGGVDGLDLAEFAGDFSRVDCDKNISNVIGLVSFEGLEDVELRSLQLALHVEMASGPGSARTLFEDIKIQIAADYRTAPNLHLMAANGKHLPEVLIYFGDQPSNYQELLELRSVLITGIKHLPPATSGAPFLLEITLDFGRISFSWAGQKVQWDRATNQGDKCVQDNFYFINQMDYAGPNNFPDYTPISSYSFTMARTQSSEPSAKPTFDAVGIKGAVSDVSPCLFSKIVSLDPISEVTIEKWGATFEDFPEASIKLEDVLVAALSISSTSAGDLVQEAAFYYGKISWSFWGGPKPDAPDEWEIRWDIKDNKPY